ncbi:radical SAM/SPASM domain-containing protein [Streptomyces scopuliridis]|uniref:radical SAM/SPASM domain-containing protein n=1 Tax=Streptomyces scopuliridis TaxID=452529 RepID=UPI0036C6EF9B
MIKEGLHEFVEGRDVVVPYRGKYAVKTPDVFARVREGWARVGLDPASAYLPMRVEMELTTKCNDSCAHCGMGALPLAEGRTLTNAQIRFLLDQFTSIGLPSLAITGGEPFTAWRALLMMLEGARERRIDISKLTTNGWWGTRARCGPVFDRLEHAGFLESRLFVPLLMLSVGEQTTPLNNVARILHHAVGRYSDRELNVAVSSLADPTTRDHRIDELIAVYEKAYGTFPHDRVHSTMRVYLNNKRLDSQGEINRPGHTPVARWMDRCFDCFAPTVGAYILPTSLLKQNGDWYTCAAFNVPEKLTFGNLLRERATDVIGHANRSAYVARVRAGHGLKALHDVVPRSVTEQTPCTSFCDSCTLLIDRFDKETGQVTGRSSPVPLIPIAALLSRGDATAGAGGGA